MDTDQLHHFRTVSLEAVLEGFGAQRDPKDPRRNWKTGDSRITVTGDKFFDHNQEKGGGGAIDLTLHLLGRDFRHPTRADFLEATRWLGVTENVTRIAASQTPNMPRV